jgi:hypothetical protein
MLFGKSICTLHPSPHFEPCTTTESIIHSRLNLGSLIGATIAFLLLQHKHELGAKHITGVNVFRDGDFDGGSRPWVTMLFTVKDMSPVDEEEVTRELQLRI